MQAVTFRKKVSRGSSFNQVYIPRHLEGEIGVGDEVEVRLIRKHADLYYSKGLKKLSEFKEGLIREVFSFLAKFRGVSGAFIVGSFLLQKIDYRDIDAVVITDSKNLDRPLYDKLVDKFNLKFHLLSIDKEEFEYLLRACPLTRAMFGVYVANQKVNLERDKVIDKKHLQFLLMMPEDLLELRLASRVFFDNLRRLITIKRFLGDKDLSLHEINSELKGIIGNRLYERVKDNEEIEEKTIEDLRKIIRAMLKEIRGRM